MKPKRGRRALTPWFPVCQPPERVGEYDYRGLMLPPKTRARWDGLDWMIPGPDGFGFKPMATDRWRGLAQKPTKGT